MSAGETEGLDLTVETLQFIVDNWAESARDFDQAIVDDTTDPADVWEMPVLRNGVEKTIYHPDEGDVAGYSYALRNNDVVTVEEAGRVNEAAGTEYDFDVEAEVDVTCEAMLNGQTVVGGSTDWKAFVEVVKGAILRNRGYPVTVPGGRYNWQWLTTDNESTLPDTEDNRDHFGTELTVTWHGYESLP